LKRVKGKPIEKPTGCGRDCFGTFGKNYSNDAISEISDFFKHLDFYEVFYMEKLGTKIAQE
jgi:hypothetical protein